MYIYYDMQTAGDAAADLKNNLFENSEKMPQNEESGIEFHGFTDLAFDCPYDLSAERPVWLLGGRPGMGKTSFALQAAITLASKGKKVYFFSSVFSPRDLLLKAMAQAEVTDLRQIQKRVFDDRAERAIKTALSELGKLDICFVTGDHKVVAHILKGAPKDAFVIVDGLHQFFDEGTNPEEYISLESALLHHPSPVLITTNVDRKVERRKDHRPKPKDLICGSLLYSSADCILTLYRPGYYNNDGDTSAFVSYYYKGSGLTEKEIKSTEGERLVAFLPDFKPTISCRLSFDGQHSVYKEQE